MPQLTYLDFDLTIRSSGTHYSASVPGSPEQFFEAPFNGEELKTFFARIGQPRTRRAESPELSIVKAFGEKLFCSVFADQISVRLRAGLDEANRQNKGLRIRLHLADASGLTDLPWEFLYNASQNSFFALSAETPIIRYLDLPQSAGPRQVFLPLRVLVVIASPPELAPLEVQDEWEALQKSLHPLKQRGQVIVDRIQPATIEAVHDALRLREYHIFHFVGHGIFAQGTQDGFLAFEDEASKTRFVNGQDLGVMLHDHRSLCLAVFNSCDGARVSLSDPFSGVAQGVVQQGIPAVVAMQFEITDRAAIRFATDFYRSITEGFSLEASMAHARKAMYLNLRNVEWGTPVLYLRSSDGLIFDVVRSPTSPNEAERAQEMVEKARETIDSKEYEAGIEMLEEALALKPNLPEAQRLLASARPQLQLRELHAAAVREIDAKVSREEPMAMQVLRDQAFGSKDYAELKKYFYDKRLAKPLWARLLLSFRPAKPVGWIFTLSYYCLFFLMFSSIVGASTETNPSDRAAGIGAAAFFSLLAAVVNVLAMRYDRRHATYRKKVDAAGGSLIVGTMLCFFLGLGMIIGNTISSHAFRLYTQSEAAMLVCLSGVFWSTYRSRRNRLADTGPPTLADSWIFFASSALLLAIFIVSVVKVIGGTFPRYSIVVRTVFIGLAALAARGHYRSLVTRILR
jgi:CHAT domain